MIQTEESIRKKAALEIAEKMATAAHTAPKTKGRDALKIVIVSGDDLNKIADKMVEISKRISLPFFERDAECIRKSHALLLIGTSVLPAMLPYCGLCGFEDCKSKMKVPNAPCAFNAIDLGIAVGSAVSIAADSRVDSRVMYSVAMAALELKILGDLHKVLLGIPICISSKSPFFDR